MAMMTVAARGRPYVTGQWIGSAILCYQSKYQLSKRGKQSCSDIIKEFRNSLVGPIIHPWRPLFPGSDFYVQRSIVCLFIRTFLYEFPIFLEHVTL